MVTLVSGVTSSLRYFILNLKVYIHRGVAAEALK